MKNVKFSPVNRKEDFDPEDSTPEIVSLLLGEGELESIGTRPDDDDEEIEKMEAFLKYVEEKGKNPFNAQEVFETFTVEGVQYVKYRSYEFGGGTTLVFRLKK